MDDSNKILTVSYGTFSCTLEGFDDPLAAMRSIAEYFRDLAADDRYFGAEPPTPDAERLHQIAEREVNRRVEARVGDDNVVLRQVAGTETGPASDLRPGSTPPQSETASGPDAVDQGTVGEAGTAKTGASDTQEDLVYAEDEEAAANATPEDISVAAKLSRIRAVVSGSAEAAPAQPANLRYAGSIQAAFADTARIEDADFEDVNEAAPEFVEPVAEPEVAAEDEPDAPAETSLAARIVKLKRTREVAGDAPPDTVASSLTDDEEADLARELAEAEREDGENGEDTADLAAETADDDGDWEIDDDEMDDEARSWMADAEEDDAPSEAEQAESDWDDAPRAHPMSRHPGFDTAKTEDAAFDRILEQTNSRMDDSEGSRRRSAIAHLKAAVAATKADRLLKRTRPEEDDAEEQSQYRDDLAKVVQPRRPLTQPRDAAVATPQDAPKAPATPLVLVSEQRVDDPEDAADEEHMAHAPDAGFAEFAERMGATELPDLLEAAAAYTAFVEGNKLFSRPDLMRRVAHLDPGEEFTREAGLRSFGQLLRQGKIQKLKRGQFTITEETRFNPRARLAGE